MSTSENRLCDPCMDEEEKHAKAYCETCDEFQCEECRDFHKVQELTSKHVIKSVSDGIRSKVEKSNCSICSKIQKESKPAKFCKDCKILLCAKCSTKHASQKASKGHTLVSASRQIDIESGSDSYRTPSTEARPQRKDSQLESIPGTPISCNISSDSVDLEWMKPSKFAKGDAYQIGYKERDWKWKIHPKEFQTNKATISDLKSNTGYIFRVRVVNDGNECPYSQTSEEVETLTSLALKLLPSSKLKENGKPKKYSPQVTEIRNTRDEVAKTKKVELGLMNKNITSKEKTIMLVGATGSGKSTLVDGIVNYVLGVNFDDPFRYTILQLEDAEKRKRANQAESQTEWITCYTIHPDIGSCLDYSLNIIDTPGFGDTRGIKHDKGIIHQIHTLFSSRDKKGVTGIDAVCFLIKAPDARLTATQVYVFESIMGLFGKNIADNICSLITFADGMDPPVLAALKESKLPFGRHFTFNNSGLFAKNTDLGQASLSPMFWDMGKKSFRAFFDHLEGMNTKSLTLTKSVLDERKRLENTLENLHPKIDIGLSKVSALRREIQIIEQHKLDAEANKNFEYETTVPVQKTKNLPPGKNVTNCLYCNYTCHESCVFKDDSEKKSCIAMNKDGYCTQCSHKCIWTKHKNTPVVFYIEMETRKETYFDKQKKYKEATGKRMSHQQVVNQMKEELDD